MKEKSLLDKLEDLKIIGRKNNLVIILSIGLLCFVLVSLADNKVFYENINILAVFALLLFIPFISHRHQKFVRYVDSYIFSYQAVQRSIGAQKYFISQLEIDIELSDQLLIDKFRKQIHFHGIAVDGVIDSLSVERLREELKRSLADQKNKLSELAFPELPEKLKKMLEK